jgi:uncharacterized protein (DUF1499 family)
MSPQTRPDLSRLTLVLAALAALLLLVAGPGARLDFWSFRTGFTLLRWAAYIGLATATAALLQLLVPRWRGSRSLVLGGGLVLGVAAAAVPWRWLRQARGAPPIHDITTDTSDPPAFVAMLPERASAPNPAEYGGAEIAAQQQQAFPDLRPLVLPIAPGPAFGRALAAAHQMGWAVLAADSAAGRIEATATTPWFGFKDDVVVRIRPEGTGSRIDVRSVSRVGQGDVGTNARRIRAYLGRLSS